jgi:hypothetical protein
MLRHLRRRLVTAFVSNTYEASKIKGASFLYKSAQEKNFIFVSFVGLLFQRNML